MYCHHHNHPSIFAVAFLAGASDPKVYYHWSSTISLYIRFPVSYLMYRLINSAPYKK